jgi:hypothetical protein
LIKNRIGPPQPGPEKYQVFYFFIPYREQSILAKGNKTTHFIEPDGQYMESQDQEKNDLAEDI